jgi:hypothetical protein
MDQDREDYADLPPPPPPVWGSEPRHVAMVLLALVALFGAMVAAAIAWAELFPIKENR